MGAGPGGAAADALEQLISCSGENANRLADKLAITRQTIRLGGMIKHNRAELPLYSFLTSSFSSRLSPLTGRRRGPPGASPRLLKETRASVVERSLYSTCCSAKYSLTALSKPVSVQRTFQL